MSDFFTENHLTVGTLIGKLPLIIILAPYRLASECTLCFIKTTTSILFSEVQVVRFSVHQIS